MSLLNYNERSWAIDVISQINLICSERNLSIKKAGGENTLSMQGGKSLFPDVLLFGDSNGAMAIQGWELKMPDTAITDKELIDNAIKKAERLNLNSFLLWNVKEAIIYTRNKDDGSFNPYKSWSVEQVKSRADVQPQSEYWIGLLKEIIFELDSLLGNKDINPVGIEDVVGSNLYQDILANFSSIQEDELKNFSKKDSEFEAQVDEWFEQNKAEFGSVGAYSALSQVIIITWINRFLFAHYLKLFNKDAELVETVDKSYTVNDAIKVFATITKSCDFMNVFKPTLAIDVINNQLWGTLLSFNNLLCNFPIKSIGQESLHKVIDNALGYSRKKMAGQFSTPPALARYLVEITIKDRTKHVIDTCCGTGTIAKSAYQLKRDKSIPVKDAIATVWASDKFAFPLQLCSIALSDPSGMGEVVQVFQQDVLTMKINEDVEFTDPFSGEKVQRKLPAFHAVVSNLPFVRFEDVQKVNPDVVYAKELLDKQGISLGAKSDLYAYISLMADAFVEENGRIGLITSNSWLGVDWGNNFRDALLEKFNLLRVVISAKGRWFKNADVVTTLMVLEKPVPNDSKSKKIEFITTPLPIEDWDKSTIDKMVSATILTSKENHVTKKAYTKDEIKELESLGVGWSSFFVDSTWLLKIKDKLVNASDHFDINRGERRGWDDMFYPEIGHDIEEEYIKPVLKNTRKLDTGLMIQPAEKAFCCSDSLDEVKQKNNNGALNWIKKFENAVNGKNKPLPDVLKRPGLHWYEMKDDTLADIVVSMNPDKKLCFYRLKSRSFVNQRLIRFTSTGKGQLEILHAVLNSAIGMFLLESSGFGRGLAALDINASKLSKKLRVLNPSLLESTSEQKILLAFKPLLQRAPLDLREELKLDDRRKFDETVIQEYKLNVTVDEIYSSLLGLFNIRQTVRE